MANNALDNATGTVFVDYVRKARPKMRESSVLQGDHWRIGILTESLIRFEWSDSGEFEDNLTQMVVNRDFGADPQFTVTHRDGLLIVDTPALYVTYDGKPFSKEGLSVVVKGVADTQFNTWHYGDEPKHNLKGTARTLDEANGEIPLDDGVISRDGWAVLDDSAANVIVEAYEVNGKPNPLGAWVMPRDHAETDFYFFGYGRRYTEAVQDFYKLAGPTPLLPRFALGNWWSRYYKYTEKSYLELMDRFEKENIPFTVGVIDMDWHLTEIDQKYGAGWTGYTWNKDFFPDPKRFTDNLHRRGMKVTLNDHPADGVRAFEDVYPEFAAYMGVDQEKGEPVLMDFTNRKLLEGYFKYVYEKIEKKDGVDFWWIDWQQGTNTAIPGLDPLWMLNHYHTIHSQKKDGKGLIFSRYAGPGSHRYPVGFSGDTVITWESLDFQPYFTATASNIGYGWWSHDIGGHMMGYKNDELALRWLQLGVFSPIMRLHSTCCEFNGKEPWRYRKEVELIMDKFLRLRHQMIPYLHTMNRRASEEGIPLIQPLYYQNPGKWDAFRMKNEYYFGSDILVNPITQPISTATRMGKVMALLPEGTWIDLFTGTVYNGDREIELYRSLDSIPVLAKAGAIVTLDARTTGNAIDNPEILKVIVAAGADGSFRLDEEATDNVWCSTTFTYKWGDEAVLTITPEKTKKEGMPAERAYELVFTGTAQGMTAQKKKADGTYETLETSYDSDKQCTTVILPMQDIESEITVVTYNTALADNHQVERIFELLNRAEIEFSLKEKIYAIAQKKGSRNDAYLLDQLTLLNAPEDVFGAVKEILTALD